jgi:hypothetical protein
MADKRMAAFRLTPEELRGSKVSDSYLNTVWVEGYRNGKHFEIIHVSNPEGREGRIRVIGPGDEPTLFQHVYDIVVDQTGGEAGDWEVSRAKPVKGEGPSNLARLVQLAEPVTQAGVAELARKYSGLLQDAEIARVFYHPMPDYVQNHNGLPKDKFKPSPIG